MNKKDILLALYVGVASGIIHGLSESIIPAALFLSMCVVIYFTLKLIMDEKYHAKN